MKKYCYESALFTEPGTFTRGVEGPACDRNGNLYAVNYKEQHTIGKVTPKGESSIFVTLPNGSVGNGIRFNSKGEMLIADYTNHNILKVNMATREISVLAHNASMNQPNDICITSRDIVFASDPNWKEETGNLWRVMPDGSMTLMESGMGTTNGIEVDPDETHLYVNESRQRRIWRYDLTPQGDLSNKTLFYEFPDFSLDGMRCDAEGNLYQTRFEKGTVLVISPEGRALTEVYVHGEKPTNITFGGPDGQTCYVTVMDRGNIETFRAQRPGRDFVLYAKK
jgi:sugar lactone lactonase YvrE